MEKFELEVPNLSTEKREISRNIKVLFEFSSFPHHIKSDVVNMLVQ